MYAFFFRLYIMISVSVLWFPPVIYDFRECFMISRACAAPGGVHTTRDCTAFRDIYCTGTWAASGSVYTTEVCDVSRCPHKRGLSCIFMCLHYRGFFCSWRRGRSCTCMDRLELSSKLRCQSIKSLLHGLSSSHPRLVQVLSCQQGWAKLVLIALERYSVALKLTFNLR